MLILEAWLQESQKEAAFANAYMEGMSTWISDEDELEEIVIVVMHHLDKVWLW